MSQGFQYFAPLAIGLKRMKKIKPAGRALLANRLVRNRQLENRRLDAQDANECDGFDLTKEDHVELARMALDRMINQGLLTLDEVEEALNEIKRARN